MLGWQRRPQPLLGITLLVLMLLPASSWLTARAPLRRLTLTRMAKLGDFEEADLEEEFVKGSGAGGQKINKSSTCVLLQHKPTGITVRCQATRSLAQNRKVAREILREKLDEHYNGTASKTAVAANKAIKNKARKKAKAKKKAPRGGGGGGRFDADFDMWDDDFAFDEDKDVDAGDEALDRW
mmetsp:Transcript_26492/g.82752  ORF Transcript_26492/g.82752 Transcript_26492/m.82752 type:complete len:182 (-) Transcript_26492:31-576(-)